MGTIMGVGNRVWDMGHGHHHSYGMWDVGTGTNMMWSMGMGTTMVMGTGRGDGNPASPPPSKCPLAARMSTQLLLIAHHVWVAAGETPVSASPAAPGAGGGHFAAKST